ncbi:uncharacterized protein BDCG_17165 [Blastomyces dermatitidis ER-3]|uniref:Uncharacterized protein n=1 Tax=Ajellomyces dermatitidis (strain ER-3 / ATCC MYA-2586) TaxID=559297 RepID=A0ABP2F1B9_AJEDR|nr:uncharacterized protein BDCG_17165 [Blastomyces dermatitidis ER-3]EEQ90520.2 hypothetical protein BDCG_17165 [Blastomyces dermatitidis ER-3]
MPANPPQNRGLMQMPEISQAIPQPGLRGSSMQMKSKGQGLGFMPWSPQGWYCRGGVRSGLYIRRIIKALLGWRARNATKAATELKIVEGSPALI